MTNSSSSSVFMRSLLLLVLLLGCALLVTTAAAEEVDTSSRRTVVLGDIHGDHQHMIKALIMADIVDADPPHKWTAGNSRLVQMGDMLDRGPDDKKVMDFLMNLKEEARQAGGQVTVILGNHEMMQLQGHMHYVNKEGDEDFGGRANRKRQLSGGSVYGDFLRSLPLVHYDDTRTIYVHAGLPSKVIKGIAEELQAAGGAINGTTILDAINTKAKKILQENTDEKSLYRAANGLGGGEADAAGGGGETLFGIHGPVWTRLMVTDAQQGKCEDVAETLRLTGMNRIIVGHTPMMSGRPTPYCDDSFIGIDVGLSRWMYGNLALMEMGQADFVNRPEEVELREIVPMETPTTTTTEEENPSTVVEEKNKAETKEAPEAPISQEQEQQDKVESALKGDIHKLQEILDVIREKQQMINEESAAEQQHQQAAKDQEGGSKKANTEL